MKWLFPLIVSFCFPDLFYLLLVTSLPTPQWSARWTWWNAPISHLSFLFLMRTLKNLHHIWMETQLLSLSTTKKVYSSVLLVLFRQIKYTFSLNVMYFSKCFCMSAWHLISSPSRKKCASVVYIECTIRSVHFHTLIFYLRLF